MEISIEKRPNLFHSYSSAATNFVLKSGCRYLLPLAVFFDPTSMSLLSDWNL